MFVNNHLEYLRTCKKELDNVPEEDRRKMWVGVSAEQWFESVKNTKAWHGHINNSSNSNWDIGGLSDEPLDRHKLKKRISKLKSGKSVSHQALLRSVIEIFAWGAMRRDHASKAILCFKEYQDICKNMFDGKLTPVNAYKEFFVAHHSEDISGMGPAYYTKLIYFLGDQSGLILDQWTGRSINLLRGNDVVLLNDGADDRKSVKISNGPKRYEKYLEIVKKLQVELELDCLSETEELIFSCSDRDNRIKSQLSEDNHRICSAWRLYVRKGKMVLRS